MTLREFLTFVAREQRHTVRCGDQNNFGEDNKMRRHRFTRSPALPWDPKKRTWCWSRELYTHMHAHTKKKIQTVNILPWKSIFLLKFLFWSFLPLEYFGWSNECTNGVNRKCSFKIEILFMSGKKKWKHNSKRPAAPCVEKGIVSKQHLMFTLTSTSIWWTDNIEVRKQCKKKEKKKPTTFSLHCTHLKRQVNNPCVLLPFLWSSLWGL